MAAAAPLSAQARAHKPYGVRGWLLVFAATLALVAMRELETVMRVSQAAGVDPLVLLVQDHPVARYVLWSCVLTAGAVAVLGVLLYTKARMFRHTATATGLAYYPILWAGALLFPVPVLGPELMRTTVVGLVWVCAWVVYIQRSQRVRVTFEHQVRAWKNP